MDATRRTDSHNSKPRTHTIGIPSALQTTKIFVKQSRSKYGPRKGTQPPRPTGVPVLAAKESTPGQLPLVPALTGIHSRAPEALGLLDPAPLAPHSKFWLPEWALAKRGIWQHERLVLGYFIPRAPSECKVTCQSRPREVSNPGDLEVGVGDGKG